MQASPPPAVESHPSCSRRQFGSAPTQAALLFEATPVPVPVDPGLPEPLRRIQQANNIRLAGRLLRGPIHSDELEQGRHLYGKRPAARVHDVKAWLRHLGCAEPIERTTIDHARGIFIWSLTDAAREIAADAIGRMARVQV
jgi:hypothetical protein